MAGGRRPWPCPCQILVRITSYLRLLMLRLSVTTLPHQAAAPLGCIKRVDDTERHFVSERRIDFCGLLNKLRRRHCADAPGDVAADHRLFRRESPASVWWSLIPASTRGRERS